MRAIFDLVQGDGAVLATGHTTAAEHSAVCTAFARQGKLLVPHAGEHAAVVLGRDCREGAVVEEVDQAGPGGPRVEFGIGGGNCGHVRHSGR